MAGLDPVDSDQSLGRKAETKLNARDRIGMMRRLTIS